MPRWKVVYYDIDNRFYWTYLHARSEEGIRKIFVEDENYIGFYIFSIEREY